MHLTPDSLKRLLAGTAGPEEARSLAAHLETECAECEALLASLSPGPLDGAADRALTAFAPARASELGNDLEYARIQRRLRPAVRRSAASRWAPLALAAGVLLVAGVGIQLAAHRSAKEGWDGVKGSSRVAAVPVRLSVVAVVPQATGEPRMGKVASGDAVSADAALQLQVEVGGAADVALVRAAPDGALEVFWHQAQARAGPARVMVGGHPAAYPLAQLAGRQRFVAVASSAPLVPERIAAAARALSPSARAGDREAPALDGVSADMIEITVR